MRHMSLVIVFSLMLLAKLVGIAIADELAAFQTVQAGQQAVYHFELRNDTAVVHEYNLAVIGFEKGLETSFTQGSAILNTVSLDAASFEPIILRVAVPLDWVVGHYTAELVVSRDDGSILRLPIALDVENTYALSIISQNVNVSSFSGQEFTFDVLAANTGAAAVHGVRVVVDSPAKWIVDPTPISLDLLAPNETGSFHIRIYIPASQIAIEHEMTFHLESDEIASPNSSLLVRVQNNPNYLLYASTISLMAVAAVFIYFRLRGRR
jgi:uncharacterized membrane protein